MRVLVTGGAGYIGSHMVRTLRSAGHAVVVVDDLSAGHRDTVPDDVPFIHADIADRARITEAMREHRTETLLHFASRIVVGESVINPRLHVVGNLGASIALFESALDAGVERVVFSSTAAVYGDPIRIPIDEDHPTVPVNPYGETKLATERILAAYAKAYGLRFAALRYFNPAGADVAAGLSERHAPETHLIPIVLQAALEQQRPVTIFGTDYDTPDGTCIRDYIHVSDLCDAHLAALDHLARGGQGGAFNLGTGTGHSVKDVIRAAAGVTGRAVPVAYGPRRAGDSPRLVASAERAERVLGWRPARPALESIVRDAWRSFV